MQIKMWFAEEGRMEIQLGDNTKTRKAVSWEVLEKATKEEPHTFTYGEEQTSPQLGQKQARTIDLSASEVRPEGHRPMAEQDRLFRQRQQERDEAERLDEEAQKEAARQAAENETAELTESQRIRRTKGLRDSIAEEQEAAFDEAQEEEDFPEDADLEEQAEEEELPAEEEEQPVEEKVPEEQEEEPPQPQRGRRGARAARR
jgi:hypothetical protein